MVPASSIPALVAPTGAGKTRALLALAARRPLAVLSADSVQAIRYFDIGSAKPTAAEQALLPHHLVDVVDPDSRYGAWDFARDADRVAAAAPPGTLVACAGTGFYLKAWSEGLPELPDLDPDRLAALNAEVAADPAAAHARLATVDSGSAARIHPNDWRRTARALAIHEASGHPASEAFERFPVRRGPALEQLGIWAEGPDYEATLRQRVDAMLAAGWIDEVESLVGRWGHGLPGLEAVGYREVAAMLDGRLARDDLAAAITASTRQYARRQRTWFRRLPVRWFAWRQDGCDPALLDGLERLLDGQS